MEQTSLPPESHIRLLSPSNTPETSSLVQNTKTSIHRILEVSRHEVESLLKQEEKLLQALNEKKASILEQEAFLTQARIEWEKNERENQEISDQIVAAKQKKMSEDIHLQSAIQSLNASLASLESELRVYIKEHAQRLENMARGLILGQMNIVCGHPSPPSVPYAIEFDKHGLLVSLRAAVFAQDKQLQALLSQKKTIVDTIDLEKRSYEENISTNDKHIIALNEWLLAVQNRAVSITSEIKVIEKTLVSLRKNLLHLQSNLDSLRWSMDKLTLEQNHQASDAIFETLDFRDALTAFSFDANLVKTIQPETVIIHFEVREKSSQEKIWKTISSHLKKTSSWSWKHTENTKSEEKAQSLTPSISRGSVDASCVQTSPIEPKQVNIEKDDLEEIKIYIQQMKSFEKLAREIHADFNGKFHQFLLFTHEGAQNIIDELKQVAQFSEKDIGKWNNQRKHRLELQRIEESTQKTKKSKILNDLVTKRDGFLEMIRLNGYIDVLHSEHTKKFEKSRRQIEGFKKLFQELKRTVNVLTVRITEYETFEEAIKFDAVHFKCLSYIYSQILSCEHLIIACEQALEEASARLDDPNIGSDETKGIKINQEKHESALHLSVTGHQATYVPFPENAPSCWQSACSIKSIAFWKGDSVSVSLYGTLPGMEISHIHGLVDTCLRALFSDKECMGLLVKPLRLDDYQVPHKSHHSTAEDTLITSFRAWFQSNHTWAIDKRFVLGFDSSVPELHSYTTGLRKSYFEHELFSIPDRLKVEVFNFLLEIMLVDIIRDFLSRPREMPHTIPFVQHFSGSKNVYAPHFKSIDDVLNKTDFFVLNEISGGNETVCDLTSYDITIGTGHSKSNSPKQSMIPEWSRLLQIESTNGYYFDHHPILFDKVFVLPYFYHYVNQKIVSGTMKPLDIFASVVQSVLSANVENEAMSFPSANRHDIQQSIWSAFRRKITHFPHAIDTSVSSAAIQQALLTIYVGNKDIEERAKKFFKK